MTVVDLPAAGWVIATLLMGVPMPVEDRTFATKAKCQDFLTTHYEAGAVADYNLVCISASKDDI